MRLLPVALVLVVLGGCSVDRAFRTDQEVGTHSRTAPAPSLPGTLARDTTLRAGPDAAAPARGALQAGTAVTASEETVRGFRRVRTSDGQAGYVDASVVRLGGTGETAQPSAR